MAAEDSHDLDLSLLPPALASKDFDWAAVVGSASPRHLTALQRLGEGQGFLSLLFLCSLDDGSSVVLKLPPPAEHAASSFVSEAGLFKRELQAYRLLREAKDIGAAACFPSLLAGELGEGGSTAGGWMLLSHVADTRLLPLVDGPTAEGLRQVAVCLAALHAAFWESEELRGLDMWKSPVTAAGWADLIRDGLQKLGADGPFAGAVTEEQMAQLARIPDATAEWVEAADSALPATLCHGDCYLNNALFAADDSDQLAALLDFQFATFASPLRDLLAFSQLSLPADVRRSSEDSMLRSWHEALCDNGVTGWSWEDCQAALPAQRRVAFLIFLASLEVYEPAMAAEEGAEDARSEIFARVSALVDDMAAAALLPEA